jgi:hypothetical protein
VHPRDVVPPAQWLGTPLDCQFALLWVRPGEPSSALLNVGASFHHARCAGVERTLSLAMTESIFSAAPRPLTVDADIRIAFK